MYAAAAAYLPTSHARAVALLRPSVCRIIIIINIHACEARARFVNGPRHKHRAYIHACLAPPQDALNVYTLLIPSTRYPCFCTVRRAPDVFVLVHRRDTLHTALAMAMETMKLGFNRSRSTRACVPPSKSDFNQQPVYMETCARVNNEIN